MKQSSIFNENPNNSINYPGHKTPSYEEALLLDGREFLTTPTHAVSADPPTKPDSGMHRTTIVQGTRSLRFFDKVI